MSAVLLAAKYHFLLNGTNLQVWLSAILQELISDGVSPRIVDVDNYEQTPLYWAAKQGDLRVLEVLIQAGKAQSFPCQRLKCISICRTPTLYVPISGAKVDARSNDGWTPLMTAASNNHLDVVVALAKAGKKKGVGWKPALGKFIFVGHHNQQSSFVGVDLFECKILFILAISG